MTDQLAEQQELPENTEQPAEEQAQQAVGTGEEQPEAAQAEPGEQGAAGQQEANEHESDPPEEKRGLLEALQAERKKRQEYQAFVERMRADEQQGGQAQQQGFQGPSGGEPRVEDFRDETEYNRALIRYEAQQIANQQAAVQARGQALQSFSKKVESAKAKDRPEDFQASIEDLFQDDSLNISPVVAQAILTDDHGPDLAYYLRQNPKQLDRLARMPPANQAMEMGRMSERMKRKAPTASAAPKPVTPVRTSNAEAVVDPNKMSTDEWIRWRNKQASSRNRR